MVYRTRHLPAAVFVASNDCIARSIKITQKKKHGEKRYFQQNKVMPSKRTSGQFYRGPDGMPVNKGTDFLLTAIQMNFFFFSFLLWLLLLGAINGVNRWEYGIAA